MENSIIFILTYIEKNEFNTMWIENYAPTLIYYFNNKCERIHQTEQKQTLQDKECNTEWSTESYFIFVICLFTNPLLQFFGIFDC